MARRFPSARRRAFRAAAPSTYAVTVTGGAGGSSTGGAAGLPGDATLNLTGSNPGLGPLTLYGTRTAERLPPSPAMRSRPPRPAARRQTRSRLPLRKTTRMRLTVNGTAMAATAGTWAASRPAHGNGGDGGAATSKSTASAFDNVTTITDQAIGGVGGGFTTDTGNQSVGNGGNGGLATSSAGATSRAGTITANSSATGGNGGAGIGTGKIGGKGGGASVRDFSDQHAEQHTLFVYERDRRHRRRRERGRGRRRWRLRLTQ